MSDTNIATMSPAEASARLSQVLSGPDHGSRRAEIDALGARINAPGSIPAGMTAYDAAIASLDMGSIASMTPEQATAKIAELTAAYNGVQSITTVLKSQPANAVEASRKLAALVENPGWRDMYAAGHPGAVKDFKQLTEQIAGGSEADLAVAGVRPAHHINTNAGASLDDMTSAAADLRARGLSAGGVNEWLAREGFDPALMSNETAIHSILSDRKPSLATHEAGKAERLRLMGDKDFLEKLNAGDPWARTHFTIVSWAVGCV